MPDESRVRRESGQIPRGAARVSIAAVDRYLRSCLTQHARPRVGELAERLRVSRGTLTESLKRVRGVTPARYFGDQQIAKAKQFLRLGWPTERVVRRLGCGSRRTFSRSFRAATGKTPAAYRSEQNVTTRTGDKPGEPPGSDRACSRTYELATTLMQANHSPDSNLS